MAFDRRCRERERESKTANSGKKLGSLRKEKSVFFFWEENVVINEQQAISQKAKRKRNIKPETLWLNSLATSPKQTKSQHFFAIEH